MNTITPEQHEADLSTFESIVTDISTRDLSPLVAYLSTTDFFDAPASTQYHLCCPGGLLRHSLNVCDAMMRLSTIYDGPQHRGDSPERHDWLEDKAMKDSMAIVSLFHDVCKANCYVRTTRNVKTYDIPEGTPRFQIKHDSLGDFIWQSVSSYRSEDNFPYGHGEKSVYLITKYIDLTDEEAMAIRYHMGPWQEGESRDCGKVFTANHLAYLLHIADEYASFITESGE